MNVRNSATLLWALSFSGMLKIQAQQTPDSLFLSASISGLHQLYFSEIGDNAQIYHGSEYIRNGQKALGFPYYESDSMENGSISYQGTIYGDKKIYYNLISDEVIIRDYAGNALINLAYEKIDSFSIGAKTFVKLQSSKSNGLGQDGFYEKLYSGEPGVYARIIKKLYSGTGSEESKYTQYTTYYVKLNDVYHEVDSKNSLLSLLSDREELLKKYIRSNKLNFKKDLENSILLSTIYYSRLKN
jgi:hypothetical protein